MIGLIGRKIGMTQIFDEKGTVFPVSVIEAGPCPVVQVKAEGTDGYNAVQIAFDEVGQSRSNLPQMGHFRKAGLPPYRHVQEFKVDAPSAFEPGQREQRKYNQHDDQRHRGEGRRIPEWRGLRVPVEQRRGL